MGWTEVSCVCVCGGGYPYVTRKCSLIFHSTHHANGGAGAVDLANAVIAACDDARAKPSFRFLYESGASLRDKIETIAREIYRADGVTYSDKASAGLELYEKLGYGKLSVCMAKTHLSLSHDAKLVGAPRGFTVPVREVRLSAGAEFVVVYLGYAKRHAYCSAASTHKPLQNHFDHAWPANASGFL